jgi:hypothetical protein
MDQGVIYIAMGEKYRRESAVSAKQLREYMDVHVTMFSDQPVDNHVFDDVRVVDDPAYGFEDKIQYIRRSPYEKTLFLDTDTYVCRQIDELFGVLEGFDIAATPEKARYGFENLPSSHEYNIIPAAFPEYNTGVLAFRNTSMTDDFLSNWSDRYKADRQSGHLSRTGITDQQSFRVALYHSDLRIATVPWNYNCVYRTPGYLNGPWGYSTAGSSTSRVQAPG